MKTDDRARFKQIGDAGDRALNGKIVSIAGMGAVGASAVSVLARENIDLRMVDKGRVEEEDMHRLALFYDEDITKFKVKQAKARVQAINPHVQVKSFHEELTEANTFLLKGDVIVDATNRAEANELIAKHANGKIPLVIARYSGSVARVLILQKKATAKLLKMVELPAIEDEGVFGPVTAIAGGLVAGEVLKLLLGEKGSYFIELDAWNNKTKVRKV